MSNISTNYNVISLDPYSVKKALVDLYVKNMGNDADTYEAGFAGYLIQAQTLLTSDQLMSLALSYNESFTHKATLRNSVNDLAEMFDYDVVTASPCTGSLTVQIQFPESTNGIYKTTIKNGTICSQNDVQYLVKGTYSITLSNSSNSTIKKKDPITGVITDIPFNIVVKNSINYMSFNVDVWQVKIYEHTFTFTDVVYEKFYDVNISNFEDSIYDVQVGVYLSDDENNYSQLIKFNKINNIYSASATDKVYTFTLGKDNTATVRFGNGVFGYQPEEGQEGRIIIYTTMGAEGSVSPNTLSLQTNLTDSISNSNLTFSSTNLSTINNGVSEEELEQMKKNIIANISSAKRLVTENDFELFAEITGIKNISIYPLLLRRDVNANEIDLFSIIYDNEGKPIPTTSISQFFDTTTEVIDKDTVYRTCCYKGDNYAIYNSYKTYPTRIIENKKYYIDDDFVTTDQTHPWYNKAGYLACCVLNSNDGGDSTTVDSLKNNNIYDADDSTKVTELTDDKIQDGNSITQYIWSFEKISDDDKKEWVCPFNIRIDDNIFKRAKYEYIPSKLTLSTTLEKQTVNAGIEIILNNTVINVLPETAKDYADTVKVTQYNFIHNMNYSSLMNYSNIECFMNIQSTDELTEEHTTHTIDNNYICRILNNDTLELTMDFSYTVPVEDIPYIEYEEGEDNPNILIVTLTVTYMGQVYNTYQRKIIIRDNKEETTNSIYLKNLDQLYFDTKLLYNYSTTDSMTMPQYEPQIENVDFGISTVLFNWDEWEDEDSNTIKGYEMLIYMYKLNSIDASNIKCELNLAELSYSPYMYGVGGNGSILVFRIRIPYDEEKIPTGSLTYRIYFTYKFKDSTAFAFYSTYMGSVLARQLLDKTMWSTVLTSSSDDYVESKYKIYKIPVIEKEYYDNNYDYLEENILYNLANTDYTFNEYKMLTDSVNIKFATTEGLTENLKYNYCNSDQGEIQEEFVYNNWAWDIAPTINAKIIISNITEKSVSDIITECKNVIFTFLTMKCTGIQKSLIRSEIVRYVHDSISDIISCEITSPSRDIIYVYDESTLPRDKDLLLSYTPEFMWINADKINITVVNLPK